MAAAAKRDGTAGGSGWQAGNEFLRWVFHSLLEFLGWYSNPEDVIYSPTKQLFKTQLANIGVALLFWYYLDQVVSGGRRLFFFLSVSYWKDSVLFWRELVAGALR